MVNTIKLHLKGISFVLNPYKFVNYQEVTQGDHYSNQNLISNTLEDHLLG